MKKWILLLLPFLFLGFTQRLKTVKITPGISAKLPRDFSPLTDDEISQRYAMRGRPVAIYSNEERTVDFGVNYTSSAWRPQDLEMMKGFYRASILNMYDEVEMITEESKVINKQQYITFEFRSVVKGDPNSLKHRAPIKKYHYIMYTIKDTKVVFFNFTCPVRLQSKWMDTAHSIMGTVKIKKIEEEKVDPPARR